MLFRSVVGSLLAGLGVAWLPSASAEECTVVVTLVTGQKLSIPLNVPAGTPLSSISLPIKLGIASVSESCAPVSSSAPPSAAGTSTTRAPSPRPSGKGRSQRSSSHASKPLSSSSSASGRKSASKKGSSSRSSGGASGAPAGSAPAVLRGAGGVPAAGNPTFSFALPGPAPLGVPNFFIDSFRIPPFLLPIYQAAGIEYDVPWQVLAAINEIETDYGRNLSVSSAGAVGWMQFLPSTWKQWGVDANGDGVADPYNPVDAIFTAARYL